jgi:hypothetical protein
MQEFFEFLLDRKLVILLPLTGILWLMNCLHLFPEKKTAHPFIYTLF